MGDVLGGLKPAALWKHFEKICSIPHPSRKEQKLAAYVRDFGKACGLESLIDEGGNVILRKPATPGMENRRGVVLQTHLDMVPQKNQDTTHNFETDPIRPRIDGDVVRADCTTLGADNGIGIAAALAVLEDKSLTHGPIEAIFTVNEEVGMDGAFSLKPGRLKGDILFNLDSEDEGEFCIGCAGGTNAIARLPYKEESTPKDRDAFKVSVAGLKGGHSGGDIHLGRANANKILTRVLFEAGRDMDLRIAGWEGGDLRNAIPRWANAVVTVPKAKTDAFLKKLESMVADLRAEFKAVDPDLSVATQKTEAPAEGMDRSGTERLLNALHACPHGPFAMVRDMPTITETSTNLAIVKMEKGSVSVTSMIRSSVESRKTYVANMVSAVFRLAGAEVSLEGNYPGWQPNVNSPVLKTLIEVYQQQFGKTPVVTATHGGLECGIIRAAYPEMDAISFGPTIRGAHSPDEFVNIPSVQKFWNFFIAVLRQIPS